ncbi:MAG: DUF1538 domain-containing protein [Acidobacteria bacterium]|nr:MAG: DUF1538 domain-containing protein [Acidobacteriota bacterium]REK02863.1 MAG: DUF1538 domain-containing protein [Acidobacteriota bacterium]REK13333.1 MAG: DUF1538 domain-containing protein [Acidobacteriota bacterium]REK41327.1 MAG: DUF1538 domain-containing protein [Acidobacteriota bacterium]
MILLEKIWSAVTDLIPIILLVLFFQVFVIQQPFPEVLDILIGSVLVIAGLMLFVEGLEIGLFPIGEALALALAKKGSLLWLILFSFALGFSTTIAEPALIAIANEASKVSAEAGLIESSPETLSGYALGLRLSVAFSVGLAIVIGVIRILRGWKIYHLIIGGYVLVMLMTIVAPSEIIGLAYDAGGVTTSTITVPLVTALGVGLSNSLKGRSPLTDGFGLIAFASLLPMIFVMGYGLVWFS